MEIKSENVDKQDLILVLNTLLVKSSFDKPPPPWLMTSFMNDPQGEMMESQGGKWEGDIR